MPDKEIIYDPTYMESLEGDSEPLEGFDPDAEYNRPAPPIHDGWYFGKATNAGVYLKGGTAPVPFRESQWKNETRPHYEVAVKVEIVSDDPLVNGKHVYTDMPLNTNPDSDRNNASSISGAFLALAGEPIRGLKPKEHAKQLVELLQSSPMGWVRVQNALKDFDADKAYGQAEKAGTNPPGSKRPIVVRGEKKIMALLGGTDKQGKFTGAADHPQTGERCASRAYIQEFKPKEFEPPIRK